jgi:hypothetical protein
VKGARIETDWFLFADYTDDLPFITFEDMRPVIEDMLKHMPKGWYLFTSSQHGNISAPMRKEAILDELERKWMAYDAVQAGEKDNRGLAQTITGLRLISTTTDGAIREYNERYTKAEKVARWQARRRAAVRAQAITGASYQPQHAFEPSPINRRYCAICGRFKSDHPK